MTTYPVSAACSKCLGFCCRTCPGAAFPSDFCMDKEQTTLLDLALASGHWCVDWWEGDPRPKHHDVMVAYYIRPAIRGKEGKLFDNTWGGVCTFWHQTLGCQLSPERRPTDCKGLVPTWVNGTHMCKGTPGTDKQAAAIAWMAYPELFSMLKERAHRC